MVVNNLAQRGWWIFHSGFMGLGEKREILLKENMIYKKFQRISDGSVQQTYTSTACYEACATSRHKYRVTSVPPGYVVGTCMSP